MSSFIYRRAKKKKKWEEDLFFFGHLRKAFEGCMVHSIHILIKESLALLWGMADDDDDDTGWV